MFIYILVSLILIGLTVISLLFFQPHWVFNLVTFFAPGVVFFKETRERLVALTIDDGPDASATPEILSLLQTYKAKATFFIISDNIKHNESIVKEMVAHGHELGNHLTQDTPSIRLSPDEFKAQVQAAHEVLTQFMTPRWLRPASGWYNAKMIETAHEYGYRVALGSLFPFDTHIPSSWFATKQILFNVRPGDIIVLHDGGARGQRTIKTLGMILPELIKRGYRIVTISELFAA